MINILKINIKNKDLIQQKNNKMKKKLNIAILGMGYVGLPLAIESGKYFNTIGFDINKDKINNLKRNIDENNEVTKNEIKKSKNLSFTSSINDISFCNFYIVCVPTPIDKNKKPDLILLEKAALSISKIIKDGDFVIFESTVYPGVTENLCKNIIEKNSKINFINSKEKKGFHAGYSPERLNPGEKSRKLYQITKIVSGSSDYATKIISKVYSKIQKNNIFVASSIKVAEAAKVIENVQRDVNIALINEFTKIFDKSNIDIFEVLNASSTKWNFHNYLPGLVGGHCIGVDPYYLSYYSKQNKVNPIMITSGRNTNDKMYKFLIDKIFTKLKFKKIDYENSKILIMGYSFKKNCSDIRNTQVERIFKNLSKKFKKIDIFDPVVSHDQLNLKIKQSFVNYPYKKNYDFILITVGHDNFIKLGNKTIESFLKNKNGLVFDINNIFNSKKYIHF